jgi:hypothetical protein
MSALAYAMTVRPLPVTAGMLPLPRSAGVSRLFLAGYASVQVIVQLRPGGAGGRNPDTGLRVVMSGPPLREAPGVLAAAGRGLIGPVIWTSREAV